MKKVISSLAILTLTLSLTIAQESRPDRGQPPEEAISACKNEDKDAACVVQTPRGDTLEGTCINTPDGKYFACVPKNHKKPR